MSVENGRFVNAAACGDLEDIKAMLADPETLESVINGTDGDGRSALHYSCLNDDTNLLPLLLADERVNVALTTPKGECIFHLAALYSSMAALNLLGKCARVMKNEIDLVNLANNFKETPLHLCAGTGDKNSIKTAHILLSFGARLDVVDQWKRGPIDCAKANGYQDMVAELEKYLSTQPVDLQNAVRKISSGLQDDKKRDLEAAPGVKNVLSGIAGGLKGLNLADLKGGLKKTKTVEKHMFKTTEGKIVAPGAPSGKPTKPAGKVLSKLVEFPGDRDEIVRLAKDPAVDVAGKDLFGVTALHKFASWNKPEFIELILPRLSPEELNDVDLQGKTALHLAVEMASVSTVTFLVKIGVDKTIKNKEGKTAMDILATESGDVIDRLKRALEG